MDRSVIRRHRPIALLLVGLALAAGVRAGHTATDQPQAPQQTICDSDWLVWVATNAGNTVRVSTYRDFRTPRPRCAYSCGGLCPSEPVVRTHLFGPFDSRIEAWRTLCAAITDWHRDPISSPCPYSVQIGGQWLRASWSPEGACDLQQIPRVADAPAQDPGRCEPLGVSTLTSKLQVLDSTAKEVRRGADLTELRVYARDQLGQPLSGKPVVIEATRDCLDQQTVDRRAAGRTGASGRLDATYHEYVPGVYRYRAIVDGVPLAQQPTLVWHGPPDPATSQLRAVPTAVWGNDDDPLTVELEARDACQRVAHRPQPDAGLPVVLDVSGPRAFSVPPPGPEVVRTDRTGRVAFQGLTFPEEGRYQVTARVLGDPLMTIEVEAEPAPKIEAIVLRQVNEGITPIRITSSGVQGAGELSIGKDTLLEVQVRNRVARPVQVQATVLVQAGGAPQPVPALTPGGTQLPPNGTAALPFILPKRLAERGYVVTLRLDPRQRPDARLPDTPLDMLEGRRVAIGYLVQTHQGTAPNPGDVLDAGRLLDVLFPGAVRWQRTSFPVEEHRPGLGAAVGQSEQLQDMIQKWIRADADRLVAVLGPGASSRGPIAYDRATQTCRPFRVAWVSPQPGALQWTTAHEIGHTYCLLHPSSSGGIYDSAAPEDIQSIGLDLRAGTLKRLPASLSDFMRQGQVIPAPKDASVWISPYRWRQLRGHPDLSLLSDVGRPPNAESARGGVDQPDPATAPAHIVSGRLYESGRAELDPVVPVDRRRPESTDGDYCLELHDRGDRLLHTSCFDVGYLDEESGRPLPWVPFAHTVSLSADAVRLSLVRNGEVIAERRRSANPPQVQVLRPTAGAALSGRQPIEWSATDPDGDALQYEVRFRVDGGRWQPLAFGLTETVLEVDAAQLPGGDGIELQVLASDGLETTTATVGPLTVPHKPPAAYIVAPDRAQTIHTTDRLTLRGVADDREDGWLEAQAFRWQSDRDGPLGIGRTLWVDGLSPGQHEITLTVRDSQGLEASDAIAIQVRGARLLLPLVASYVHWQPAWQPTQLPTASPPATATPSATPTASSTATATTAPPTDTARPTASVPPPPSTASPTATGASTARATTATPSATATPAGALWLERAFTSSGDSTWQSVFATFEPIKLWLEIRNTTGMPQEAVTEWIVRGPGGFEVPGMQRTETLNVSPDRPFWSISTTLPSDLPVGEYTFTGRMREGGQTFERAAHFIVADARQLAHTFETPTDAWPQGERETGAYRFIDGMYGIRVDRPDYAMGAIPRDSRVGDFALEVSGARANGNEGDYGLLIGRDDDRTRYNTVRLDHNGRFAVHRVTETVDGLAWDTLVPWTPHPALDAATGAINHVFVLRRGPTLTLYANGQRLTTLREPELPEAGTQGVIAGTFDEVGVEHRFDQFRLYRIGR